VTPETKHKLKIFGWTFTLLAGAVAGVALQTAVDKLGIFGPTTDVLISEQKENFVGINQKIDSLRGLVSDPKAQQLLSDLAAQVRHQNEVSEQVADKLQTAGQEAADAKSELLKTAGVSSGIGVWLAEGESVNVGSPNQVFALRRRLTAADLEVTLSGNTQKVGVGDVIKSNANGRECNVLVRQVVPRQQDGRLGFDVTCGTA